MSAPFQPGDVVVCVDDRDCLNIRRGAVYRVAEVRCGYDIVSGESGAYGVVLAGVKTDPGYDTWHPIRFRKIDDEVSEDFREQMRSLGKRTPVLNPARHSRERVG